MLADGGRADRGDLGRAVEMEGARHGEPGPVGEGNQGADLARLRVVRRLVDRVHSAERHAGLLENGPPFREVAAEEDLVEDLGQYLGVGASMRGRGKARI